MLREADDVFTNHIHADDLARACVAALHRGLPQRVVHASDDTEMRMGDYFDLAADLCGLPRPPRVSREDASAQLSPMLMSFMSESRRLDNRRLVHELRLRLRYPTCTPACWPDGRPLELVACRAQMPCGLRRVFMRSIDLAVTVCVSAIAADLQRHFALGGVAPQRLVQ